jgi:nitrite reductase/ring-hydroxylating ferredoxin subunit
MTVATEHRIARLDEIPPGEGRTFTVAGRQIAVFRQRDGQVRALDATCPHAGGPLADGLLDDTVVVCPLHSHTFELATGCSTTGQPPLRTYPTRIDDTSHIVVSLTRP